MPDNEREDPIVVESSYIAPTGERVLRHEVTVDAPVESVWAAFTTSEGLRSFVAPVTAIDLRIGGHWEVSYDPNASLGDPRNIINEILSYLPMRMLSIRIAQTPPGFPHPEVAPQLCTVIEFEPLDERRTRVTTSMLGWRDGEAHAAVYEMFRRGNEITALNLYDRFRDGPRQF